MRTLRLALLWCENITHNNYAEWADTRCLFNALPKMGNGHKSVHWKGGMTMPLWWLLEHDCQDCDSSTNEVINDLQDVIADYEQSNQY